MESLSSKSFLLSLVTPERLLFEERAVQATIPTEAGEITILPDHVPYIGALTSGEITTKQEANGKSEHFSVSGGFVEFHGNTLSILADRAERADEIDLARAEEAIARATALREEILDPATEEYQAAVALLERSWARLRVAKKHRSRHGDAPESGV